MYATRIRMRRLRVEVGSHDPMGEPRLYIERFPVVALCRGVLALPGVTDEERGEERCHAPRSAYSILVKPRVRFNLRIFFFKHLISLKVMKLFLAATSAVIRPGASGGFDTLGATHSRGGKVKVKGKTELRCPPPLPPPPFILFRRH